MRLTSVMRSSLYRALLPGRSLHIIQDKFLARRFGICLMSLLQWPPPLESQAACGRRRHRWPNSPTPTRTQTDTHNADSHHDGRVVDSLRFQLLMRCRPSCVQIGHRAQVQRLAQIRAAVAAEFKSRASGPGRHTYEKSISTQLPFLLPFFFVDIKIHISVLDVTTNGIKDGYPCRSRTTTNAHTTIHGASTRLRLPDANAATGERVR